MKKRKFYARNMKDAVIFIEKMKLNLDEVNIIDNYGEQSLNIKDLSIIFKDNLPPKSFFNQINNY